MKIQVSSFLAVLWFFIFCTIGHCRPYYIGYSGAPGSNGTCASSCHGIPGGTIEISGFPSEYVPEQTYSITISHNGGDPVKQFNGSCRIGSGSENAGIIVSGTNTATYDTPGETNGIHLSSSDRESGTFFWTAPAGGTGEVRLYIAGHQGRRSSYNTEMTLISSEISTVVQEELYSGLPEDFKLDYNYPNPFNASTVIHYGLPRASDVTIEIYDVLGRVAETLAQGRQQAGYYQVRWDARGQPSGMYFYRIKAGEYSETKKMVLLK